ncbi:translation initiation factor IF-3 [Patescibacteria group bacterium]|nr:MAG: translation initiation factor IF-3 [Patescibacteria group bacterium]
MRISHKKRKPEPKKIFFRNEGISAPEILVLDSAGANVGVLKTGEAIRRAREEELDLVLINPKSTPPVAKIMDFGQFRYQQEKEERIKQAHQHETEVKGVRLSLRIGPHDMDIRKIQAIKFLNDGDKVKIEIILRGRETQQKPAAREVVSKFTQMVDADLPVRLDQPVEVQFNKVTAIIAKK